MVSFETTVKAEERDGGGYSIPHHATLTFSGCYGTHPLDTVWCDRYIELFW